MSDDAFGDLIHNENAQSGDELSTPIRARRVRREAKTPRAPRVARARAAPGDVELVNRHDVEDIADTIKDAARALSRLQRWRANQGQLTDASSSQVAEDVCASWVDNHMTAALLYACMLVFCVLCVRGSLWYSTDALLRR